MRNETNIHQPDIPDADSSPLARLIKQRRSVNNFQHDRTVSPETVVELLETAVYAPNHRMTEPWRFVFVDSPAAREELAEISGALAAARGKDPVKAAAKLRAVPCLLFVVMRLDNNALIADEDYAAACCVVQNFLLLATERGLATFWKTMVDDDERRLGKFLRLADDERVVAFLHVGYPAALPPLRPRRPVRASAQVL